MTKQYGRRYKLHIGSEAEGISIDNLRISFEFQKSIDKKPNEGEFSIYNLNPSNRRRILSGEFKNISFALGYNELRLVYIGRIIKAVQTRSGLDWMIKLECADGDTDYAKAYSALTIAAGSTDQDIIEKAATSFSETKIGTIDYTQIRPLPRAKVLFGNTRDILTQVVRNTGSDWSIQDGELVVLPPDKVLDDQAILLSMNTGMISTPEQTDEGLQVQCLINPALKIGGMVRVASTIDPVYDGDYKNVRISYKGDTHSDTWQNELTLISGTFQKVEKKK